MIPQDIDGLRAFVRCNSANYQQSIWTDPLDGAVHGGFPDLSPYGNAPLVVRSGAPQYDTRGGAEGLVIDQSAIYSMTNTIVYDGTIVLLTRSGYLANNTRYHVCFEDYDQTTTRTGNPAYCLARFVGSGNNRFIWGVPATSINVGAAGVSAGDDSLQALAFSANQAADATVNQKVYGKRQGQALIASADLAATASVSPVGADLVLGRLRSTEADGARTALTGAERLWVHSIATYDRDLINAEPDDLENLLLAMAAL